jgi:hypothetical protein
MNTPQTGQPPIIWLNVLVFSLTFAIAAIGVLLQLFGSGLDRLHRVGSHAHLLLVQRQVLEELMQINPAEMSEGEGEIEGLHYRWHAELSAGSVYRRIYYPAPGFRWEAALFDLEVTIDRPEHDPLVFHVRRLGWRQGS